LKLLAQVAPLNTEQGYSSLNISPLSAIAGDPLSHEHMQKICLIDLALRQLFLPANNDQQWLTTNTVSPD
jgi:hypothetical protein